MITIQECAKKRILILDGAMGTMVQRYALNESDFRGQRFCGHKCDLKGNNDILNITRPDVIFDIHSQYLLAGADLIETNTFNSNIISQQDYGIDLETVKELNFLGAQLAREAADKYSSSDKPRFVCGVLGPTSKSASISPDVNNAAIRDITFDNLLEAYYFAAKSLWSGGVDAILIETIFDTLNAKAAVYAVNKLSHELAVDIPLMISGTITDKSGRTLSGQTPSAFWTSLKHAKNLISIGFNCALGAKQLKPHLKDLANLATVLISAHPNAGLPNELGGYEATPESFAEDVMEFVKEGLVNIVGGCCGTTPEYIEALAFKCKQLGETATIRQIPSVNNTLLVSGLESQVIGDKFINVGERTNVAGSKKFLRLIQEKNYTEAIAVARQQVEAGAQVIDINMDDGLLDGKECMITFLNLLAGEPEIARVPVMLDSSKWEIIEAALKCVQGKCIVNSISLKHGEEEFLTEATKIQAYGAAVVVMAFDEYGQADSYEKKIAICERAYNLLCANGFPAEDIIFDPNVLTVATGIEEHNKYGLAFIEATRWIKKHLPFAKVSAGVSNISFAFRGNDFVRSAMHTIFLYHATKAGLDMGIVNAGQLLPYTDISNELRIAIEDVLLDKTSSATENLLAVAAELRGLKVVKSSHEQQAWREANLAERLKFAILRGIEDFIAIDIAEAIGCYKSSLEIIEGPLMAAMNEVGELFGAGKMFLPQVVKSARVMKKAVACLAPLIEKEKLSQNALKVGKFVIATVKGDVHDIGKNIVSVVLACNGFEIIDLGVMVPCEKIIEAAKDPAVVAIGLSGLITPSLDEMVHVAKEMEKNGISVPLVIGGATTSALHTALKIAPNYNHGVMHVSDASKMVVTLKKFQNDPVAFLTSLANEQAKLRKDYFNKPKNSEFIEEYKPDWSNFRSYLPNKLGITQFLDFPLNKLINFIDWRYFFAVWGLKGAYPEILELEKYGGEARKLYQDAKDALKQIESKKLLACRGVVGIFPANSEGNTVEIYQNDERNKVIEEFKFEKIKMNISNLGLRMSSFADRIAPKPYKDYLGMFTITSGLGIEKIDFKGDAYLEILYKALADRLVEAFSEVLHTIIRRQIWGYELNSSSDINYELLRPAIGYPILPNHADKKKVFKLLKIDEKIGIALTESYALKPASSECGFYYIDPATSPNLSETVFPRF